MSGYNRLESRGQNDALEDFMPSPNIIMREETDTGKFIMQKFYGFQTMDQVYKWRPCLLTGAEYCSIHEVIRGDQPQRIKFDIDAKHADMPEGADIHDIVKTIMFNIIELFYEFYQKFIDYSDLIITNSNGEEKYSYHIIIANYYVANNNEAKYFAHALISLLPEEYRKLVDRNVYGKIQNFRILGAAKLNSTRIKKLDTDIICRNVTDIKRENYLLIEAPKNTTIDVLPTMLEEVPSVNQTPTTQNEMIEAALALAKPFTEGHEFVKNINRLLCFKRMRPTYCRICGETHSRDNSMMILILGVSVYEKCKQYAKKLILIGKLAAPEAENILTPIARALAPDARAAPQPPKTYGQPHNIYDSPQMNPYELTKTLFVRAPMKIGKSKALKKYIETHFVDAKIRIISFRQTFSNALAATLSDFVLYSTVDGGNLHCKKKLIIQVESLHRIGRAEDDIDLVVLDESESILEQFSSGLHGSFNSSWAIFESMMRRAKHVLCMDANLEDVTVNTVLDIRGKEDVIMHYNMHLNCVDDKYWFTSSHNNWLAKLHEYLVAGKRLVIPTNSLTEGNSLYRSIKAMFPNKVIQIYSSETKNSIKNEHFADVATHWGALDILIYTPTCSAGVSFELAHFDALFGYFTDDSCTVETCRQMLGRVRILNMREYFICLSGQVKFHPVDTEEIKQQLRNSRSALFQEHGGPIVPWHYGDCGEILFYESPYFKLWIETLRMRNLSKNGFVKRFIRQIRETGAAVSELPGGLVLDEEFRLTFTNSKKENNLYYVAKVAESANITDIVAAELYHKIEAQSDLTDEERYSLEKYNLLSYYGMEKAKITSIDFVTTYSGQKTKEVYKNLLVYKDAVSVESALDALKAKEMLKYKMGRDYATSPSASQISACDHNDLTKQKYTYNRHYIIVNLLSMCGLSLFGPIPTRMLMERIEHNKDEFMRTQIDIEREFDIHHSSTQGNPVKILKVINTLLRKFYGLVIRQKTLGVYDIHALEWEDIHINFIVNGEPVIKCTTDAPTIATQLRFPKLTGLEILNIIRDEKIS